MNIILLAVAAFVATLLGGLFAIRFRDKLHLILGFSAGAIIGVAFFDLLPEAIELGSKTYDVPFITMITAIGFISYMLLDRFVFFHSHEMHSHEHENEVHHNHQKGIFGAGSLSLHSFLDGVAIGLAFQVSTAIGMIVAVAVLVHDFSDGINTVNMILKNGGDKKKAFRWLMVDALAPVLGIFSTMFFTVPQSALGIILAVFSGFFLYIGASDLLPESHHNHPTYWTTFATILGVLVIFIAIKIAGV